VAIQVLQPTTLEDVLPLLPGMAESYVTLCIEPPLALATPQCRVVAFELDDADLDAEEDVWIPPDYEYLLEADVALEAAEGVDSWRRVANAPPASARERAAAVIYYAIFDAWLPIGEENRPAGGNAQWGSSAKAAAAANLQTASERLARFPDQAVPSYADQRAVRRGDVVDVMAWIAHPDGPRAEIRPVRIESIDGDLLTASAVGANITLQLRHDHIFGVGR
jgi:hypothetical protein